MWIHTETGKIFYTWDQLRLWLVQNHNIARVEDSSDLVEILAELGVALYVAPEPVPIPQLVPQIISMRQCELYLYDMDDGTTLQAVYALVPSLSPKAQIEWKRAGEVWRSSPMVEQMRMMFGWTVEQMDQMFRDAEQL